MSRLGKKPITVPAGVTVAINGRNVTLSAGSKKLELHHRPEVVVKWNQDEKSLSVGLAPGHETNAEASKYWGTTRALLNNMVNGLTKGYEKSLEVVGVGYTAEVKGKKLDLKLGFANVISVEIPAGLEVKSEKNVITIKGADRQVVGQFAAVVRSKRPPEPYNGKGIKYTTETIKRKQGKAFGA